MNAVGFHLGVGGWVEKRDLLYLLLLIAVLFGFDSNLWAALVGVTCPVGFEVGVETKQNLTAT
jgi:hypothetical protein